MKISAFGLKRTRTKIDVKIVMNLRILFFAFLLAGFTSCIGTFEKQQVSSPDKQVELEMSLIENKLNYQILWSGEVVMDASELSLFSGKSIKIVDSKLNKEDSSWKPVWGQFSTIRNNYKELELDIETNGMRGKLLARVFNDGVAFRFILPQGEKKGEANFFCEYNLPQESSFYAPLGESEPLGPLSINELNEKLNISRKGKKKKRGLQVPLVVETQSNSFIAILESDLYSAQGFSVMNLAIDDDQKNIFSSNEVEVNNDELITPWRVILFGKSAGDLVVNTTPVNLAAPCKLDNTDWIKPGLSLWDWRVHSYKTTDGFEYGINTESYKRFIDFAAEFDIDYFLIDDSWYKHVSKGHFEMSEKLHLDEVVSYAKEKDVELMLYYDRKHGEYGDKELFPYYSSLSMKGIKYGFMGSNVPFTRSAIEQSAESKLLIDFHDGPVPFTGIRRTLPNAITREYCHAQQDSRRAFTPESFIKMALINAITGPLDMNNGNFDLIGINRGDRTKGPRVKNSYPSTVVSEAARTLIIFSGLVCIPDAPEAYKAKKDLFEFIQKLPIGKWDESKILNSKIGEYITTARRHDKEWFIASVISQKGGTLDVNLDFLEAGIEYDVTFYEDTNETHCKTNPEAYQIRTGKLKKGDVVNANLAPGGGHCMWIRPISN